ncbi:Selenoprotein, Rdx-type [Dillenia turbinata]|uniref:Selenoprotein, Rdx-type n=1 Tax=Dillenia turbinata TaxID=194707 RepID=A0AAN8ZFD2_9MAGN
MAPAALFLGRGTAVTMKKMLETSFPKIHVILENHPAPLGKRLLANLIPVMQIGVTSIVITGEQIFPMMGITMPPQWYLSLRANRFGAVATTWLIGNTLKSTLQSSGAFEVHYNGKLVFSKLKEDRFPGEIELRDLIARRLTNSKVIDNVGNQLSSFSEDLTV